MTFIIYNITQRKYVNIVTETTVSYTDCHDLAMQYFHYKMALNEAEKLAKITGNMFHVRGMQ